MILSSLGWDDFFASHFAPYSAAGLLPARVALHHKHAYIVLSEDGEHPSVCTGRLLHDNPSSAALPVVGDWVALRPRPGERQADIHAILPRRSKFSRQAAGETHTEQILATNIDTALLVTALDHNYNLRRIERALATAWASGAQPVVVLNKSDLHPAPESARTEVAAIAQGAPVITLSAAEGDVLTSLSPWLTPGRTLALLGSSGVGKSTLTNRLLGTDHQRTSAISAAIGKGRHTTTHRELTVAPSGILVIDTPGLRELQLWDLAPAALDATFADVTSLVAHCRFRDCSHGAEPGCAIQAALAQGTLAPSRWQSFQKLQREQAYAARQADPRLARATKSVWKKLNKSMRDHHRFEERD